MAGSSLSSPRPCFASWRSLVMLCITANHGTVNGYRTCRFEWVYEISQTLILPWSCTDARSTHSWQPEPVPMLSPLAPAVSSPKSPRPFARG